MRKNNRRFRVCADLTVQLGLVCRVAIYWLICQAVLVGTILVMLCIQSNSGMQGAWGFLFPAIVASTLVFSLVALDLLVFSNRIVGPMQRLRSYSRQWGETFEMPPLRFRTNDYYADIAESLDKVRQRVLDRIASEQPVPTKKTPCLVVPIQSTTSNDMPAIV